MKFSEHRKIVAALNQVKGVLNDFHTIAGTEAVNFYTKNFTKQGFDDNGVEKWKPRKRERTRDSGRAILVKSGNFRRSLLKKRAGKLAVYIVSPLPYAKRHNEGLDGMPKRQVVGSSKKLNKDILSKLDKRMQQIFR
jgi:phage gpG-like protein